MIDKKINSAKRWLGLLVAILAALILFTFTGCNSEKKLTAKAETFIVKYPKKALPFFRGKFPCIETKVITYVNDTAYKASIDSIKAAIEFYKALLDAVEPTYIHDTVNKAKKDSACPDYRSEINRLNKLLKIKDAAYKDLLQKVDSVKPINTTSAASIEDLSRIAEMDVKLNDTNKKIESLEAKNKHKGKVIIWLIVFLVGLLTPYIIKAVKFFTI